MTLPVLVLVAAAVLGSGVQAQERDRNSRAPSQDVRVWLTRIHEAASRQNFQGTFVVSSGGNVASARMAHFSDGSSQFERIESLDGQARNVFRHNDTVHTLWPKNKVALVERRNLLPSFPALLQAGSHSIAEWYEVQPQGPDRVAGHEADVLLVRPKDAYRYGYRLWSDQRSGLLLRADVIAEQGQVVETSAFSDIVIGVPPNPESVLSPMKRLDGYRVIRPDMQMTQLEAEGWSMRSTAPGFRLLSCVRRDLGGTQPAAVGEAVPRMLQAIYADGMTYVSVFIEPYREAHHAKPMPAPSGATRALARRHAQWWVTVIGDVPMATLERFADGLERQR